MEATAKKRYGGVSVSATYLVIIILCVFYGSSASARVDDALSRIDRQRELYPQERLHAVTDRDMYCAGDTVWLRVFVTDAATLRQTAASRYAYVELRNPFDGVSRRVKIMERDGVYAGYVPLAEDLPEGDYTLVAYTVYSENTGSDYFFRKPLRVLAPYSSRYAIDTEFTPAGDGEVRGRFRLRSLSGDRMDYNVMSWEMSDGRRLEMPDATNGFVRKFSRSKGERVVLVKFGDYARYVPVEYPEGKADIRFYPEGGWLIAGEPCTVAFKATDRDGRGVPASGVVRDDTGADVARFSTRHKGMGTFDMVPEEGRTYTAEYIGPDGERQTAEVGTAKPGAAALRYGETGTRSLFSVAGGEGMDLELVVASRGIGVLATPLSHDSPVSVDKRSLGTGLYQAMLVSRGDSTVVSERLFFVGADRKSPEVVDVSPDSTRIMLKAPAGTEGDCCVRILGRRAGWSGVSSDIRTQLLLQSELRGRIEDAGYYFREGDREAHRNLDLLMLVNGWSRYNLPEAILGKYREPEIPLEVGQEITGQVRSRWRGKPLEGIMVCAISPKADFGTYAETDSAGMFRINGFDLPEDTPFIFRAMNEKGGNEGNYDIYDDRFPQAEALMPERDGIGSESEIADFFKGSKWIMLDEIKVQAFKNDAEDIYSALSSYSKKSEDFERQGITSIEQAIRGISGMMCNAGRLFWRRDPVVYYIDGTLYDPHGKINEFGISRFAKSMRRYDGGRYIPVTSRSPLARNVNTPLLSEVESIVPFHVIDRIDFVRPENSIILGRGYGGGALVITTKSGDKISWNRQFELKDYLPLGYQRYKEYVSPLLSSEAVEDELDMNSTLLWLPSVKFDKNGKDLTLSMPVTKDYTIEIEGLTDNDIIHNIVRQPL